ncbi:MAG TPA: hypothetical protein DG754_02100 [Bacteroidales bacterium]|nr:hypothetical protein [Bacteroidales bacterium]
MLNSCHYSFQPRRGAIILAKELYQSTTPLGVALFKKTIQSLKNKNMQQLRCHPFGVLKIPALNIQ